MKIKDVEALVEATSDYFPHKSYTITVEDPDDWEFYDGKTLVLKHKLEILTDEGVQSFSKVSFHHHLEDEIPLYRLVSDLVFQAFKLGYAAANHDQ